MRQQSGKQLHDRTTRGQELSPEEQTTLDAWYARQDAAESSALAGAEPLPPLAELRAQVDDAIARLQVVTREIETQAAENERLRRENADLQRELSESRTAQRA